MDKSGCIITYPVEGYRENALKCVIRLGVNKVILLNKNEHYVNLFNEIKLTSEVIPIPIDNVSSVVNSVAILISDAKKNHDEVSVLLLPSDLIIAIGMYIAACMEKIKALTPVSDFEIAGLTLPLFPFVNLNKNEKFVLARIIENERVSTKNLFAKIKKEYCDMLYPESKNFNLTNKEKSAFRQFHRMLNKLEKMELISKEKRSKNLILNSTSYGKLTFGQRDRNRY